MGWFLFGQGSWARRVVLGVLMTGLVSVASLGLADRAEAAPKPQKAAVGWMEVQTEHFTLYSNTTPRRARRIAHGLEGLRGALKHFTGLKLTSRVPSKIYVFDSDRLFTPYKFLYQGEPAEVAGYFLARDHANFIALSADNVAQGRAVVYHEYVHDVLNNNFRDVPVWFNEGMAEYYSTFELEGENALVGLPVSEHWQWLSEHELLPLETLFAVDRDSEIYNEGTRRGSFYAQSWALVHYLLVGNPDRQGQVIHFLNHVQAGLPQREAFQKAFGADYGVLEEELRRYLRRLQVSFLRAPLPEPINAEVSRRDLAPAEILALLGDLLANQIDLRPEAEPHYQAALELVPEMPQAIAGLGLIAERRLDLRRAQQLYLEASRKAPDDYLVLYRLAKLLLPQGGSNADQARALLRRCITLRPDFAPAWSQLSYAISFLDPLPDDALVIGQTAFTLWPTRWDVALNLLSHYTRLGHRQVAESMLTDYFTTLDRGTHLPQARQLLIQMDLRLANEAANAGQDAAATQQLDQLEARFGEHLDKQTRRQVGELRDLLAYNRAADRYNAAVLEINAGKVAAGRALLEALLEESPDGPIADGARQLLRRITLD